MLIRADLERCIGAGQCGLVAPELFDQADDGTVRLLVREPDHSRHHLAREAEARCPSQAITIQEE